MNVTAILVLGDPQRDGLLRPRQLPVDLGACRDRDRAAGLQRLLIEAAARVGGAPVRGARRRHRRPSPCATPTTSRPTAAPSWPPRRRRRAPPSCRGAARCRPPRPRRPRGPHPVSRSRARHPPTAEEEQATKAPAKKKPAAKGAGGRCTCRRPDPDRLRQDGAVQQAGRGHDRLRQPLADLP